jgi:hypothetical protein
MGPLASVTCSHVHGWNRVFSAPFTVSTKPLICALPPLRMSDGARVLRCVNSPAYAVRVRVTNLHTAVAYLGAKQIRNLALTASISDLFRKDETTNPYKRGGLWRHLVSVGRVLE